MKCLHCQNDNIDAGAYCMYCGGRLDGISPAMPTSVTAAGFCTLCGTPRAPQAAFCEQCGAGFSTLPPADANKVLVFSSNPRSLQDAAPADSGKKKSGSWLAMGVVAGVLALAAGGGTVWLFSSGLNPEATTRVETTLPSGDAQSTNKDAAFRHFTKAMEAMERVEQGKGDENTVVKALEDAEQATLLDPTAAAYWHMLGYVYSQFKGDQQASVMAEDSLQKALAINPANLPTRLLLARLLLDRESYALALDQLEWVGKKNPALINSALTADMCRAYVVDKQAGRGEAFFSDMQKIRPESSALRLGLAILQHEQGQMGAARRQLSDLISDARSTPDDVAYARTLEQAWQGGK